MAAVGAAAASHSAVPPYTATKSSLLYAFPSLGSVRDSCMCVRVCEWKGGCP